MTSSASYSCFCFKHVSVVIVYTSETCLHPRSSSLFAAADSNSAHLGSVSYNAPTAAHHAGCHPSVPRPFSGFTIPKELSLRLSCIYYHQIWNVVKRIVAKSLVRKRSTWGSSLSRDSLTSPFPELLHNLFQLINTSYNLESRTDMHSSITV